MNVVKFTLRPPITADGNERFEGHALIFQNSGTSTVMFSDNWTLPPGATLQLGRTDDDNTVIFHEKIRFDQTAGNVNRLEVMVAYC